MLWCSAISGTACSTAHHSRADRRDPRGVFRVADSQVASRWGNITEFKGFDLITPNEREARFALADQDSGIRPLASRLYDAAECKTLILKLGERGVLTCCSAIMRRSTASSSSTVSSTGWSMRWGQAMRCWPMPPWHPGRGSPIQATILGSIAAATECERDGNIPVAPRTSGQDRQARKAGELLVSAFLRVIVVGLGVQGYKRRTFAGDDFVASVDPVNEEADYGHRGRAAGRLMTRRCAASRMTPRSSFSST